jgi:hypothetical protein
MMIMMMMMMKRKMKQTTSQYHFQIKVQLKKYVYYSKVLHYWRGKKKREIE